LRLRGLYLALATLAFGLLVDSGAVGLTDITGGPSGLVGIPSFTIGPLDFTCVAIFNVLELPVTQVPLGLGARGLPLGVQVVGVHGEDHVTIAVAQALEEMFGGWTPPRQFEGRS